MLQGAIIETQSQYKPLDNYTRTLIHMYKMILITILSLVTLLGCSAMTPSEYLDEVRKYGFSEEFKIKYKFLLEQ